MEEESTLVRADDSKPAGEIKLESYSLYFKGLVSEETAELLTGFGVAICDKDDNLLFQMKEQVHNSRVSLLEVELMALKRGLTEAVGLGIDHKLIYCDHYRIFELVMERSASEQENIALLMDDMFSVALCGHEFCVECVKQHIEVRLLAGGVPRCPHYQCETKLTLGSCVNLLTSKLKAMWERIIDEESIHVADRVYCPNPRCSALMSVTKLSNSTKEDVTMRSCFKCGEPLCIKCKVPWHSNLSCNDYKRLGPNPTADDIKMKALANKKMWRQCENCQHIIERSEGCIHIICRFIAFDVSIEHEEELEKSIGDQQHRGTYRSP
ncbi:unnamed protein product [Arabidopsis arenosa]|uniref:RBR-type E3 ubiquitin transferase n=1 Tax=Arabidopsis arenosa TaxID=38785 RepID=A0A8S2A9X7_ARAAE|nr:unnamed protein product [Arabidopsis arenosa]